MEPILDHVVDQLSALSPAGAVIPIISNLTGAVAGDDYGSPQYWVNHLRATVRFSDGITTLHQAGVTRFLEVGPGGTLSALIGDIVADPDIVCAPTLRRDRDEATTAMTAAAQAYVTGATLDWPALFTNTGPNASNYPPTPSTTTATGSPPPPPPTM